MRDRIVIANWKMNGSREANRQWVKNFLAQPVKLACRTVVCAPFIHLPELVEACRGSSIEVGAEDVNENVSGAFTGEVSAAMLAEFGLSCAIVGHSERRRLYGETDNRVAMKAVALVRNGLKPIVCVGETLEERERGDTPAVILRQLNAVLSVIRPSDLGAVAYEPVWAIGTGRSADPETAQAVHACIRQRLVQANAAEGRLVPILYGGSVTPDNAAGLFRQPDIDGALVGGASLNASSFYRIGEALCEH
ncbi:triose-phosphate isomerase [Sutterella sp.]|uniref:triose-phosphate isomerase n=1 Tax=Sutterella sp. TaxID=1981025 RepID=UPI0026E0EE88|nr:triose-phosphate isomerase [Sutterella sp.]MDO5531729.1 triose-phosphate isomerase [Sutterella sp.]